MTDKNRIECLFLSQEDLLQAGCLDIYANLVEVVAGEKGGRETAEERVYFNAVGLAYVDVAIAHAMYQRAQAAGKGRLSSIQETMIFQHEKLADWIDLES